MKSPGIPLAALAALALLSPMTASAAECGEPGVLPCQVLPKDFVGPPQPGKQCIEGSAGCGAAATGAATAGAAAALNAVDTIGNLGTGKGSTLGGFPKQTGEVTLPSGLKVIQFSNGDVSYDDGKSCTIPGPPTNPEYLAYLKDKADKEKADKDQQAKACANNAALCSNKTAGGPKFSATATDMPETHDTPTPSGGPAKDTGASAGPQARIAGAEDEGSLADEQGRTIGQNFPPGGPEETGPGAPGAKGPKGPSVASRQQTAELEAAAAEAMRGTVSVTYDRLRPLANLETKAGADLKGAARAGIGTDGAVRAAAVDETPREGGTDFFGSAQKK